MDNKTQSFQFRKTKLALAVAMTVSLAACGVDGDEGSTSTSNTNSTTDATQPIVDQVTGLMGTVSGKVQDTNGRPVAGAAVFMAGHETTTDAGGNYVFDNVQVTNVNGNNDEGNGAEDDENLTSLTVTIQGPDGYISAVVNVDPQAMVNNTGGSDANSGAGGSVVTTTTFVDGFIAEAGIAVIAEESATITGYLRIGDSTPAAGEVVYLDFTGYGSTTISASAGGTAGSTVTLSPNEYTTTTEADGSFTFTNVPADSTFVVGVTGKTITTADTDGSGVVATDGAITVGTVLEQDENFIGTFQVVDNNFAVETRASYNPWVSSVTGVLNPGTGIVDGGITYGDLNQGYNKEITINFSEALDVDTFMASDVVIAETGAGYLATDSVALSEDGTSLVIVFTEELAEGTKFTVFIPQASSVDADGEALNITRNVSNNPTNTPPYTDGSATSIVYDDLSSITNKAKYVEVNLCTYLAPTAGVEGATLEQVFDESTSADGGSGTLQSYSDAFRDAENSETNGDADADDIAQLNGDATTAVKLKAFADTVLTVVGGGETLDDVDTDFPWVTVDSGNASSFSFNRTTQITDDTGSAAGTAIAGSSSMIDRGVDGAWDGMSVTATFLDDFSVAAATASITLVDAVPPVTVLQENYNLYSLGGYAQLLSTAGEADYGDGGEVVNDGSSATAGNPLIWIQPRHLQQKGTNNAAPARDLQNTFGSLNNLAARVGAGEAGGLVDSTTVILGRATYDAAAYTAWAAAPVSNEIGVDFSENIAVTGTPATSGISTALSSYLGNNNVTTNVDGVVLANSADLVQVTVANVMTLANDDNTGYIDFDGAVSDTAATPNVANADTQAKVIFRDAMPPLVTAAGWDGTSLTVTFNEAVSIGSATTMQLSHPNTGADVSIPVDPTLGAGTSGHVAMSNNNMTATINVSAVAGISAVFAGDTTANDPAVDEYYYDDGGNSNADDQHTILRWDNITDANGNDWDTFTVSAADADGGAAYTARYHVDAPQFLAVNELGSFTVTPQNIVGLSANGATDADGNFQITLDFTHPINIDIIDGADNILTEAEIAALFYLDINGDNVQDADGVDNLTVTNADKSDDETIDPAIDDISVSNNNQRITITVDRADNAFTVATAYVRMLTAVQSALIPAETIQQDFNIRN